MFFWLPLIVIAILIVAVIITRGRQFGDMARDGVPVRGKIVKKFRTATGSDNVGSKRIAYEYVGPDGVEYHRASTISEEKWRALEVGDSIDLVCLSKKAGVSAPAWLIDLAREALDKK